MSKLLERVARARELRDAARNLVREDFAIIRGDISARGLGRRAAARAERAAGEAAAKAAEFADEHRAALAGIGAVAAVWLARTPLIAAARSLLGSADRPGPAETQAPGGTDDEEAGT